MSDFRNFNQDYYIDTRMQRLKLKRTRKGRLFFAVLLIISILAAGGYSAFVYADDLWAFVAGRYFDNRLSAVGSEMPQAEEQKNPWLNILLLGVDQRKNEPARADTLMLAMVNLKEKTIHILSIPRDTRVKIEGISHQTRINHAHSNGGVELTRKTVENLLGIPVHTFVETNFEGFENVIDTLGGVTIDVEKRMYYPSEDINLRKGLQRLDGHDALAYVRFRSDGKGDLPRIERQHKFLEALAGEALQPKVILKLPRITGELHNNVSTDMSVKDMLVLAGEFKNVDSGSIRFYNIPGEPKYINGASYYVADEEKLKFYIEQILSGQDPLADNGEEDKVQYINEETGEKGND